MTLRDARKRFSLSGVVIVESHCDVQLAKSLIKPHTTKPEVLDRSEEL